MRTKTTLFAALACTALAACATAPKVSPVEITRFHQPAATARLGQGKLFVESAPGQDSGAGDLAVYKSAVASRLASLGYQESARADAAYVAQVRLERYVAQPAVERSPVSVGGGGSVGSYGSGIGLGVGINLGGGQREMIATDLGVMIRDAATNNVLWEGRASISVSDNSEFADSAANALVITEALFREFPGNNGETTQVSVKSGAKN